MLSQDIMGSADLRLQVDASADRISLPVISITLVPSGQPAKRNAVT